MGLFHAGMSPVCVGMNFIGGKQTGPNLGRDLERLPKVISGSDSKYKGRRHSCRRKQNAKRKLFVRATVKLIRRFAPLVRRQECRRSLARLRSQVSAAPLRDSEITSGRCSIRLATQVQLRRPSRSKGPHLRRQ
jgi:hypothetical protein